MTASQEVQLLKEAYQKSEQRACRLRELLKEALQKINNFEQWKQSCQKFSVKSFLVEPSDFKDQSISSSNPDKDLKRQIKDLEEVVQINELDKNRLEKDKNTLELENKELRQKLSKAKDQIDDLKYELEKVEVEKDSSRVSNTFKEKISSLDRQREALFSENKRLTDKVDDLEREIKSQARSESIRRSSRASGTERPLEAIEVSQNPEMIRKVKELKEENDENKADLKNLRYNLNESISNSKAQLLNKIEGLKKQISDSRPQSVQSKSKSHMRDMMILKEISYIPNLSSARKGGKHMTGQNIMLDRYVDKENDPSEANSIYDSINQRREEPYNTLGQSERQLKGTKEAIGEKEFSSLKREPNTGDKRQLIALLDEKDREIDELNQMLFEQKEEFRKTLQNALEEKQVHFEPAGDMSVRTEDIAGADPYVLMNKVKSLSDKQSKLDKQVLGLKHEIKNLETDKKEVEQEVEDLNKMAEELKEAIDELENEKASLQKANIKIQKDSNYSPMKSSNPRDNVWRTPSPTPQKGTKRGVRDTSASNQIEENLSGGKSNFMLLKRKFDEIQVFVTRVAGLLSKAVLESRLKHTSALPASMTRSKSPKPTHNSESKLKEWLTTSPSKAQVDKESAVFYLKFKKRFDKSSLMNNFRSFRQFCK